MTLPLFFADAAALVRDRVVLDGAEGRHAADVRRLRPGEVVEVGDGRGHIATGLVAAVGRGHVEVDVSARREVAAPSPRLVVVQALAKGGRDEDAVEAMTEVGVDEVVPWVAARSVARPSEKLVSRWAATARAAAKQARRPWVPDVAGVASTEQVCRRLAAASLGVVLHEGAEMPLASAEWPPGGEVVVVVGPEGGLTENELLAFGAAGAGVFRLGADVLRTSTAGVAALCVLSALSRWR